MPDIRHERPYRPFRRRLTLHRPTPASLEVELEDHIHHVAVSIEHGDGRVGSIAGRGVRLPWSLCSGATAQLDELVGSALGASPAVDDAGAHCTHLLDAASSAIRFGGSDAASRRYDLTVTDWNTQVATGRARRDDGRELVVRTDGRTILDRPYEGRSLGAGFARWAMDALDPDEAELALLLRRAIWMRASPAIDLDQLDVLRESGVPPGSCFASQPERIDVAIRNRGSSLHELPGSPPSSS
jgi:hypothetical protein